MKHARSTAIATATRSVLQSTAHVPAQPKEVQHYEASNGLWQRIAVKAYELWEQRGRRDGYDLADWLDAEAIVMEEMHEARE